MVRFKGSDSSMDDCNIEELEKNDVKINVQIPLWTIVTIWMSSVSISYSYVQIPLWTIVTRN